MGSVQGNVTSVGQAATAVVKIPDDPNSCPFPGYGFDGPRGAARLHVSLRTQQDGRGWLSLEVYGPDKQSYFPNGTQAVGPAQVHTDMAQETKIDIPSPHAGSWQAGLKPQGAFHGSFNLTVTATGDGPAPGKLNLKPSC